MTYRAEGFIETTDGDRVVSGQSMKVLGFHFTNKPSMQAHVDSIRRKIRIKYWTLFFLRDAGFSQSELAKVYRTTVLPLADYCAPVYHSMLTDLQDQELERCQSLALKCIYGPGIPYETMRKMAKVTTLRQRRIELTDKFAKKCLGHSEFQKWFPLRPRARAGNRGGEKYLEESARTDRLMNSPVFYMRRRLNGKIGKKYGERNKKYRDQIDSV